jgi:hypothetical protein
MLSSRACEAGLHLCIDLFQQVLTQADESGAPPIQRLRSQNPNFNARETLFGEKNVIKQYTIKFIWGLKFRPVDLLQTRLLPRCLWS